jgi:hypothetical protein
MEIIGTGTLRQGRATHERRHHAIGVPDVAGGRDARIRHSACANDARRRKACGTGRRATLTGAAGRETLSIVRARARDRWAGLLALGSVSAAVVACGLKVTGSLVAAEPDAAATTPTSTTPGGSATVAPTADVAVPESCEKSCPAAGGQCDAGTCVIKCAQRDGCSRPTCPFGLPCDVTCSDNGACTGGVDCAAATTCNVSCVQGGACGPVSCSGGVRPGAPPTATACTILCSAGNSCTSTVTANAQTVDVTCNAGGSCHDTVTCGGGRCAVGCIAGGACSQPVVCCASECLDDAGPKRSCP